MAKVTILVLAAGSSSRMGQSKQLLPWQDQTLLRHAVATAVNAQVGNVVVVLGSNADKHLATLQHLPVTTVINPRWESGMGASLKFGLTNVDPASEALIVMVCDQPFVTATHLRTLVSVFESRRIEIVASEYGTTRGVPALFSAELLPELAMIADREGARALILKYPEKVASVHLERGEEDVDTYDQYLKLLDNGQR